MARISSYAQDSSVTKNDKVLGTDSSGSVTRNFTIESISDFLSNTNAIGIANQINFEFVLTNRTQQSISFENLSGNNTAFNAVSSIVVSDLDAEGNNIGNLISQFNGKTIILARLDDFSNFGIFKITNVQNHASESNFKTITLTNTVNNGSFIQNKYYGINLFPTEDDVSSSSITNAGGVLGSGTSNKISKFSNSNTLANSTITDDGSTISTGSSFVVGSTLPFSNTKFSLKDSSSSNQSASFSIKNAADTTTFLVRSDGLTSITGNLTVTGAVTANGVTLTGDQDLSPYATLASPAFTGTPTAPTASTSTNSTQIATTAYVTTAVSNLIDSAPGALNTLNELAAALGDDANFSTTVTNNIAGKLPLTGGTLTGNLTLSDDVHLRIGNSGDLRIFYQSSSDETFIQSSSKPIIISTIDDIIFKSDDDLGGITNYFSINSSTFNIFFNKDLILLDNVKINLGTGQDLKVYHDGSNSYINNTTGDLKILNTQADADVIFQATDASGGLTTYFFLDGSLGSGGFTIFPDNTTLGIGSNADLRIKHNGTDSSIQEIQGHLTISNSANDKDIIFKCDDGSGGVTEYFRIDGGQTQTIFSQNVQFQDNARIKLGSSGDLQIYHTSSNSLISQQGTGDLIIEQTVDDSDIIFKSDNGVGGTAEYFRLDGGSSLILTSKNNQFVDNAKISMGSGNDLLIYHNATDTLIENRTGDLLIINSADDKDIALQSDDGSGGTENYIKIDGSAQGIKVYKKLEIQDNTNLLIGTGGDFFITHDGSNTYVGNSTGTLHIQQNLDDGAIKLQCDDGSGGTTSYLELQGHQTKTVAFKDILFQDSVKAEFGNSNDLQILHDGSNSNIINYTGHLVLRNGATDKDIIFQSDDGTGSETEYLRLDGSSGYTIVSKKINFSDDVELTLGSGNDLKIKHDGSNSSIINAVGNLEIRNNTDDGDILFYSDDGSGGTTEYLRVDGGLLETVFSKSTRHMDTFRAKFGSGEDLSIYHDGSNSYINETGTGSLLVQSSALFLRQGGTNNTNNAIIASNGSVSLYHDNSVKLATASTGVNVTGTANIVRASSGATRSDFAQELVLEHTFNVGMSLLGPDGRIAFGDQSDNDIGLIRYLHSDDTMRFTVNASEALRINSSGNVGIGTTGPDVKLHVESSSDTIIKAKKTGGNHIQLIAGGSGGRIASDHQINFDAGGNSGAMLISTSGKIGIGTTNPQATLSIGDNIGSFNGMSIGASANRDIRIGQGSSNNLVIGWKYNATATSAYSIIENFGGNNPLILQGSGGNIGVGILTPSYKLDISGDSASGVVAIRNGANGRDTLRSENAGGTRTFNIGNDGNGHGIALVRNSSGTTTNYIAGDGSSYFNAGNIGIGTTSPDTNLHIKRDSANAVLKIERSGSNSGATSLLVGNNGQFQINSDNKIKFTANGSERMRLETDGNLGIGTTSPVHKLSVIGGNFQTDGIVYSNKIRDNSGDNVLIQDNGGNVGIGTTSPGTKLQVAGTGNESVEIRVTGGTTAGNTGTISVSRTDGSGNIITGAGFLSGGIPIGGIAGGIVGSSNTSAPAFAIQTPNSSNGHIVFNPKGTEKMRITATGDIGIGTTTPSSLVHVAGDIRTDNSIIFTGTGLINNNSTNLELETVSNKDIILKPQGTGNVGIGTTSPSQKLEINGNLTISNGHDIFLADNGKTHYGASNDLEVYHDGSNSYVKGKGTGNLIISQESDDKDIIFQCDDGSGGVTEYFKLDGGNTQIKFSKNTNYIDGIQASFGNSGDLKISHSGTNSAIENETGHFYIINDANDSDIVFQSDDGSGGVTEYFRVDGASEKTFFTKPILFFDGVTAQFGTGADMIIYHNGAEGTISNSTGNLRIIQNQDNADIQFFCDDGSGGTTEYFRVDGGAEEVIFSKEIKLSDTIQLKLGDKSGGDLTLQHNGSNSFIGNVTGHLTITNSADDQDIVFRCDDGSGGIAEYFKLDGSNTHVKFSKNARYSDNVKAEFGNSGDLDIVHTGTESKINNTLGHLKIQQEADDADITFQCDDGSGGITEYFRVDGGSEDTKFSKDLHLFDNVKLKIGSSGDFRIEHNSANTFLTHQGTGDLFIRNTTDDGNLIFQGDDGSGGNTEYFRLDGGTEQVIFSKNVGINTSSPTEALHVVGNVLATAFNTISDVRLKNDFKDFSGLDIIDNIKVYDFAWKNNKERSYGVKAHELQEVLPHAVTGEKDSEKMQQVDYTKIVPILLKSIKELKQEIKLLKSKL